jgi:hypothetical protein
LTSPPHCGPLNSRTRQQALTFRKLARRLSAPTDSLHFLSRFSFGGLFIGFSALDFTEQAIALKFLFQNPEGMVDIVIANENFQSELLSRCTYDL